MNSEDKKALEDAFNKLFMKCVDLYTHGTLTQYGLDEKSALEIVSNLTELSKESLVSIKDCRDDMLRESVNESFETINNVLGAGRSR